MKPTRRGKMVLVTLAAIAVFGGASAGAILAAGNTITVRSGELVVHAEAAITPSALPRDKTAPISFQGSGSVETLDGSHVPPAQTLQLRIDRHFKIETSGLPVCTLAKIRATSPAQAMQACGAALLGRGHATAQVAFPEQAMFSARGRLLAFNGPTVGGYSEQLDYLYVDVPAPTAVIVTVRFSKGSGPYGYDALVTVPRIAGGAGSLTGFELTLDRRWTYKGRRRSYLGAECPDGHFSDHFEVLFGDGTILSGTAINSCRPQG